MANHENTHSMKIMQTIATLIIGFLAGVGTMQATLVGDVREHTTRINHVEAQQKSSDVLFEQRISYIVKLLEQTMESNREMISMVKQIVIVNNVKAGGVNTTRP